jgi:diguanylate cyclase (GGDEF)-like protein
MDRNQGTALVKDLLRALELRPDEGREGWTSRLLETLVLATGAGAAYLAEATASGWTRQIWRDGRIRAETFSRLYGLAERMARGGAVHLEPEIRRGSVFRARSDGVEGMRAGGFAAGRVPVGQGPSSWLVLLRTAQGPPFGSATLLPLELAAEAAAVALSNGSRWRRIETLAMTDGLTRVPNYRFLRRAVDAEVSGALCHDEVFTLAMVDVDNLKMYNEAHGHLAGSALLRDLARLMREGVRRTDTVGKYGGDEFLLILPRTRPAEGVALCERVRRRIEERLRGEGGEVISCSFGVAGFPGDGCDFESLVSAADGALYRAKHGGRNAVVRVTEATPEVREAA